MGDRSRRWVYILFLIGACSLGLRILLDSRFGNSAFVYLAVPFGISVALFHFTTRSRSRHVLAHYFNHMRDATIVMLATSAVLFEGFICVLMFMPIYYFAVTLGFLFVLVRERFSTGSRSRLGVQMVPAVVMLLSLEGVVPWSYAERTHAVTHTSVVAADIHQLRANLAQPIAFERDRRWFISVFPLPHQVEAGSLAAGDIHTMHFSYSRWFVTNVHDGEMRLRIEEVGPRHVRTRIIDNTSYLASYLRIEGTEIRFAPIGEGRTEVSLTVTYTRLLDPAWYFGPLQRMAVQQSAEYLMDTVIARSGAGA